MTSAIIVAAGSSRRMGFNKLLAPLAGLPVLERTLHAFAECEAVDEIIIVCGDEISEAMTDWDALPKVVAVVPGGAERHDSVWAGLLRVAETSQIVAVHDGGRPLITSQQIERCITVARERHAAASARPITETLKRCDETGRIVDSIERTGAWIMETPQVFRRELLVEAYEHVLREKLLVTDEVSAVQALGHDVYVVDNPEPNLKITYPADLALAERLLA
jgi:2-C-methyl-D-erythritol 4-phosphate cytidylyltransferase